jgi:hypothetical protein
MYTKKELIPEGVNYINKNDAYFEQLCLFNDEVTRKILYEIDKAMYNTDKTFIGRDKSLGAIYKEHLSTGSKTLLNVYLNKDTCFDLLECGPNCLHLLIQLSNKIDGTVFLRKPTVIFRGDDTCNICCDGVIYTHYKKLFNAYYYGGR